MTQGDLEQEVRILRQKLTETEDAYAQYQLNTQRALTEAEMKINVTMTRLLAANDVSKHTVYFAPMRTNILEHMNDLRRQTRLFFVNAGVTNAS